VLLDFSARLALLERVIAEGGSAWTEQNRLQQ